MAHNTRNPLGSTDPRDLYDNAPNFDNAMNANALTWVDRFGVVRKTLYGSETEYNQLVANLQASGAAILQNLGYYVPVPYVAGLNVTKPNFTVSYNGVVYAAQPGALPFVTGAWNAAQWYPIQNSQNGKSILQFGTRAEADAAAATLPEGTSIVIKSDADYGNRPTINTRQAGGGVTFDDYFDVGNIISTAQGAKLTGFQRDAEGAVLQRVHDKLPETAQDWGHKIDPRTPYPYPDGLPFNVLNGSPDSKFALTLAKTLAFTDTPNFKLNERMKNAINIGVVRVAIVGDSITAGADNWRSNSYVSILKTKLQQTFPWVKFEFANLAIGGMSAGTLNSDSYKAVATRAEYQVSVNFYFPASQGGSNQNDTIAPIGYTLLDEDAWPGGATPGKTWKEHVIGYNPDMIVYAFGMNDGTDFDGFLYNYSHFQDYVKAQLPNSTPWFTLVSCFLPDMIPPAGQPHATWQRPAQCISDMVKALAKRDSYGHIDANSIFNLLREGTRLDYAPLAYEGNFRFAQDAGKWAFQQGLSYDASTAKAVGSGMAARLVEARDLDFSATYTVTAFFSNWFVARIGYRCTSDVPGTTSAYSADVSMRNDSTIARITLYYKTTAIATATFDMGAAPAVGQTYSVKVRAMNDHHEIWLNDMRLMDIESVHSLYRGSIHVGIPQGTGTVQQLGLSFAEENAEAPIIYDRKSLLGTPIYDAAGNFVMYGDFITNPDSLGGNVVNHPTAWGHNTYYAFGVMRFVEALKQLVNQKILVTAETASTFDVSAAASTPQKVDTVPTIRVNFRKQTLVRLTVTAAYSGGGAAAGFCQLGFFVNGGWTASSYIPVSGKIGGAGMRMVRIEKEQLFSAGKHTIELGVVRNSSDAMRVGEVGTVVSISAQEL